MITESEFIERDAELRRKLRELKRDHERAVREEKQRHREVKDNEYELHGLNMGRLKGEYYEENGRLMEEQTALHREWAAVRDRSKIQRNC